MTTAGDEAAPGARRGALERGALRAGDAWAERVRERLASEGRAAQGGWPGTLSEARGLAATFSATLDRPLTFEEGAWVARAIYARSKQAWLARSDPDGDDEAG